MAAPQFHPDAPEGPGAPEDRGEPDGPEPEDGSWAFAPVPEKRRWRLHTGTCTGKSAADVLKLCAQHMGLQEMTLALPKKTPPRCLIYVMQTKEVEEVLERGLPSTSAVARFPGMPDLCDKGSFTRIVAHAEALREEKFSWWPRSYVWPEEAAQIQQALKTRPVILKPDESSQGDGISLCLSYRDLEIKTSTRNCTAVVQRYIAKPLLLDGVKFDFRIYVLVSGQPGDGLSVHVCREGLARFCTEKYVEPTAANLHKVMGHLTNYSLNKRSAKFAHAPEGQAVDDLGATASKRLLSTALAQIQDQHPAFDGDAFWEGVDTLVSDVVALLEPFLACSWRRIAPEAKGRPFQLLGFDVILDSKLKPWLLEVNNSPSLCIDETFPVDPAAFGVPTPAGPARAAPQKAELGQCCRCMDLQVPHVHERCQVDVYVKQMALGGAFARVIADIEGQEYGDDGFVEVQCGMAPASAKAAQLWQGLGGAAKAFTSHAIRKVAAPAVQSKQLSSVDVDIAAQRFKKLSAASTKDNPDLQLLQFEQLLAYLAEKARPGAGKAEALEWLLAQL